MCSQENLVDRVNSGPTGRWYVSLGIAPGRKYKRFIEPQRGGTNTNIRLGSPRWGYVKIVLHETWADALVITHEIGVFEMDLRSDDVGNY